MSVRLDHANLSVRDVEGTIRFLTAAFPDFRVRGRGPDCAGLAWVHVGNDRTYLSLLAATGAADEPFVAYGGQPGLNHLGFEVDDVAALRARLRAAGYRETTVPNAHPHRRRVYFADAEGNDWEFVEYRSQDPAERNDYALADAASADDPLDAALDELAASGPELANGFTSHAPMVVEALVALGRPDAVLPWLASYRPGLLRRPAPRAPIAAAAWREALGRPERTADWMELMRRELAEAPWRAVLGRWLARLAPAYCATATHGVLRVAHAVRSLERRKTPQRLRELGDALGAWAAEYQTLPTPAARTRGRLAPGEAIAAVPLQPSAERRFHGSIVSALEGLAGFAPFAPVIDWIDAEGPPGAAVSALTHAFARVYLANARDPLATVVFVHAVTSAAALRSLLPHAGAALGRELIRYAWQAGAALYASLGSVPAGAVAHEAPLPSREALVRGAVANGDDHAIKFVEACLREHAEQPDPLYLAAAAHALAALPPARR